MKRIPLLFESPVLFQLVEEQAPVEEADLEEEEEPDADPEDEEVES